MIITKARVKFASLQTPNEDSKYTVAFFLDNKDEETKLIEHIEAQWVEKSQGKKASSLSYKEYAVTDDKYADDEDIGKVIFNASKFEGAATPSQYKFKQYDAKNREIMDHINIGSGSIININASNDMYRYSYKGKFGLILNLNVVQIISLNEGSDASGGFEEVEGFETTSFENPAKVEGV